MAAATGTGTMKYWIDGLPFQGIPEVGNGTSGLKFWIDGLPQQAIFPPSGAASNIILIDIFG